MKASVLVTTYNHADFVEDAVESVLAQRTGFAFEVVMCDDASTDATRSLLQTFVRRDPTRVRLLVSDSNVGTTRNLEKGLRACTGDYVAVLEGDDYWISPHKLQAQADFLDRNPQCSFNFTGLLLLTEGNVFRPFNVLERTEFTTEDLVAHNFIANLSTCMYRRSLVEKLPDGLFETYSADWILNLAMSEHGSIGCLPQQMVAYRRQGQGHWASMSRDEQIARQIGLIADYDAILGRRFTSELAALEATLTRKLERQRYFALLASRRYARAAWRYPRHFLRSLVSAARSALVPPVFARLGARVIRRGRSSPARREVEQLTVPRIR